MVRWFCLGFGLAFIFIGLLVELPDYVKDANSILFWLGVFLYGIGIIFMAIDFLGKKLDR